MLTLQEYQFGGARNSSERIIALFQLRNSTAILIIQCLADREVQKDFYKTDSRPSAAYHYNCAVIHQPHRASQIEAVKGHGWDSNTQKPLDRNLWLGRVLHGKQIIISNVNQQPTSILNTAIDNQIFQQLIKDNANLKNLLNNEMQRRMAAEQTRSQSRVQPRNDQTQIISQLSREKASLQCQLQQARQQSAQQSRPSESQGCCCIIM